MKFQVLTLFPERYTCYTESGLPARAYKKGLYDISTVSLRRYANPSRGDRVDDTPYGGGPGMVLEVGPVYRALQDLKDKYPVVLFTPRGKKLNQKMVRRFSKERGITLLAGYFEGVDERIAENLIDYQISIGDFILGSGDLPALCFIESITRLIPGYMSSPESLIEESNENEFLEYPQYTKPAEFNGWKVPEVLLSGNHQKIREWRLMKSREITEMRKEENELSE